ncbi:MAG: hypothetical protein ACE5DY_08625, partial [Mariprofundaceae bacterium]
MTPFEKLKSLPDAAQYLKPGVTFEMLDAIAMKQPDLDAWKQLQKARAKLFDTIFGQTVNQCRILTPCQRPKLTPLMPS